ncbi:MAG TPA: serine hydrolase [Herpetosiphonaceae bacterium]|nr:serine hydrolase [Herpetosiphonaceae bacterium]
MCPTIAPALPRTSPEYQGVASSALLRFVDALDHQIDEVHSFMLLRHGSVIAEGWWSPYGREHPHLLFSLSKSFTATAVGLALAEGRFSLDDPVLAFFPDEAPADQSDLLAALRVRHLLSMTTGQAGDAWSAMVGRPDGDWIAGFLGDPVVAAPGSRFVYNTGATYMLSAIVRKTTGINLLEYLGPRLFAPLGIENARWQESPQGITVGGIGLSLRTEDVARFGQLYLQKGLWGGRRILPQAWVEEATALQIAQGDHGEPDWTQGYGYQFWRCRHGAYRGDGVFGQFCIVMPDQDAVLAITGGVDVFAMQPLLNLVWDHVLPAMGAGPLAEDAASQRRLSARLASLRLPAGRGQAGSPMAAAVSGRPYRAEANALGIETITLDFAESGWTFGAQTAAGQETIPGGYGAWQPGQTALFKQEFFERTPSAASGAWTAEDTFAMGIRLYETPFSYRLACHFAGDELLVEIRVNVSLESAHPLLLTARRG